MSNLPIPEILTELQQRAATVTERIYGLENYLRLDLNDDEKTKVSALRALYIQWAGTLDTLTGGMSTLAGLGYPTLPTMEVPASMMATLDKELHETQVADGLFTPEPVAAQLAGAVFNEPIPKS